MERGAVRAPCEHAGVGALAQGCCGDRKLPEEARGARNQEPRSPPRPEVPYCDLPSWPPASAPPAGATTSGRPAPAGPGPCSGPERDPLAECPSASGSRSWDPESVPYLEGPAPAPGDSWDQDEDSDSTTSSGSDGGDAPDGTRSPFSADGDPAERQQERRGCGHLPTMIPRKPQEGLRADSARAAAVLARSPGGEDAAAGQRKEDPGGGCRSAGQRWAKLRGESGHFLDHHRPAPSPAPCTDAPGGPRSGSTQTPCHRGSAHRDTVPAASTPPEARPSPWDKARTLVTPQERPRASATQHSSLGAPSPSRAAQRDNARASSTQRSDPQVSSPTRAPQQEHSRTSSLQQENPSDPFPHQRDRLRTTCSQQDHPRASSPQRTPQRGTSRTFCAQQDSLRASSPHRTPQKENSRIFCAQQDTRRASSPNRSPQEENSRAFGAQRDNPRASSPNRSPQKENSRTFCAQRDNPSTSSPNRSPQKENSRTFCAQRDNPRDSSPNRTPQKENSRTFCVQRDNPSTSSLNRSPQKENSRTFCAQRDNPSTSSPNRYPKKENSRTFCAQRDSPRASSPNRSPQRGSPRTCTPQSNPRGSSTPRDHPKPPGGPRGDGRPSPTHREPPSASALGRDHPGASPPGRPPRGAQQGPPRSHSPHRTNRDIPWASFPLRPTQGDGPRPASPARARQSEVPWASIALRPTQGERAPAAPPARPARAAAPSPPPPPPPAPMEPPPACAVCIGHRDAPRASSPPRHLQHDPFPFFPDPHASEGEGPHHEPPYVPPAVCIGHRDAPRASSPPRHAPFDPFPFLPDAAGAQGAGAHHELPQHPPFACIGHRDAPRASSPPRQPPEPGMLLRGAPRASAESLAPSADPAPEPPPAPGPVCIGHRDAPGFSAPPRQAPEPALCFQDAPGASLESLALSTDSLRASPGPPPPVCIGHRDAPRASSPPRHPPSDLALLATSPPPGSSGGSRASAAPGETRHNLEREEYSVLADLPPPRRRVQREPPQPRTPSPGRAEVERLFGQERRKSEAPGAFQAREEGRSRQPGPGQMQLPRRQSSPALGREVTPPAEPARPSHADPRSPQRRRPDTSPPPRTSARTPERERRAWAARGPGQDREAPRQPAGGWSGPEPPSGCPAAHGRLQRSWASQEEGDPGLGAPPRGSSGSWGEPGGPPCHGGHSGAWEAAPRNGPREPPHRTAPRGWGSLQELFGPHQPRGPPDSTRGGHAGVPASRLPETPPDRGPGGACPHQPATPEKRPEFDWRDLVGLLGVREPAGSPSLPRLCWDRLLELLQAPLPRRDPGPTRDPTGPAPPSWPEGGTLEPLLNGHDPAQGPQGAGQDPSPACTPAPGPHTRVDTSGQETPVPAGLKEEPRSPAGGPSSPEKLHPEEPEGSELSRGPDSPGQTQKQKQADSADKRPAESKAGSPLKGRLVTSWRMPGDRPTLFNPLLLSLGVLRWQRSVTPPSTATGRRGSLKKKKSFLGGWKGPGPRRGRAGPERRRGSRAAEPGPTLLATAMTPDLLNFKKGWMSILDEPGEWKKHWFVLTDSSLKYYRDSTAEEADELDGEVDLRACTDVTEYPVQRNYGFQIHTKDAVYTLSAMTSGIRRNWIEALRKTVRPANAPDVTKLSDSNKENTLHGYSPAKGTLRPGEPRGGSARKADGPRPALDYVELSPLSPGAPPRARAPARPLDRPAKQEELERDLAQRSEERRRWFEATDGGGGGSGGSSSSSNRGPEPAVGAGEAPRRGLGAPLTADQQSRLSEEIEKKWQELEKLPLREGRRVPLSALLGQGQGQGQGHGDGHEALEREVQSLRAQLEAWRLRGETPGAQDDGRIPPGYISQEACERSLAEMESSHQQLMEELQRHHARELQRLQQEKERLLAEETAATASAIEAVKKAYKEELSRELSKTRGGQQGPDGLRKQHQSDVEALRRELQVLSEGYSQKCLEIGALTRQAEEREHQLRCCQQEGQELLRHNQDLHGRLSEEIERLRSFIASQGAGNGCGRGGEQRSSCELEVLLRVKENELQYLKREVQALRDELQTLQKDKRFSSGQYQDVYVELNHIKTRSEREIEQLKEHLRLAMAALQERAGPRHSLAD
ncbi:TRIO and F-actin-binding protein [Sorex araneus]|uniref:TRIO and F-actin-binding protein n=1 Tax=Sorex araneus TaxID=42254 RepID=UPI0024335D86|nr:TRIO and F-actin-binding protein [Sorex araneus]